MTRPIHDTQALWTRLSPDQQQAIGVAAIDREIVIHGRDEIDDPMLAGAYSALEDEAEDRLIAAVGDAIQMEVFEAEDFPLPSFASSTCSSSSE